MNYFIDAKIHNISIDNIQSLQLSYLLGIGIIKELYSNSILAIKHSFVWDICVYVFVYIHVCLYENHLCQCINVFYKPQKQMEDIDPNLVLVYLDVYSNISMIKKSKNHKHPGATFKRSSPTFSIILDVIHSALPRSTLREVSII